MENGNRSIRADANASANGSGHKAGRLQRPLVVIVALTLFFAAAWFCWKRFGSTHSDLPALAISEQPAPLSVAPLARVRNGMILISGGEFLQGRNRQSFDARPARRVRLSNFEIDQYEVTNRRFQRFVQMTGFATTAERRGFGWVYDPKLQVVRKVKGAKWNSPQGPQSSVIGRDNMPVVQVSFSDAQAFASWDQGKRLPSEAEFEYAAAGGSFDHDYPWGGDTTRTVRQQHNIWLGAFPHQPSANDGYRKLAPVGAYPPNRYGVHDATGNVREWCGDWYGEDYYQIGPSVDPRGPRSGVERVVRGGSWMSTESSRMATVWRRDHLAPSWSDDQTGFRCARDGQP